MLNKTHLSATTPEPPASRTNRKYAPADFGDFAGLLNVQTEHTFQRPQDFGRDKSQSKTASPSESREASMKKSAADDSSTDRSRNNDTNDSNVHNTSEKDTDNAARSSTDSKTEKSQQTTQSVDGGNTNSTPGASTEAAVNAQPNAASENPLDLQLASQIDPAQASELQQLLQKIAGESPKPQVTAENTSPVKISAKAVESKNPNLQTNLNLTTQQILFETGLAEHFVRLLTDQFDQLEKSTSKKSESASTDTTATTPTLSLGSPQAETSKTLPDLAFPAATPTQTPEDQAAENISKIMHIVRSNLGRRQSQLTVRLDPPELGKMQVDVKVIDNTLQLAIVTDTAEAKQMLASRMETLRTSLEQNGINLSRFEIVSKADNPAPNQNNQQFQDPSQNANGGSQQQQQHQHASNLDSPEEEASNPISTLTGVNASDENLNLVA